jgi:hypothetical protein
MECGVVPAGHFAVIRVWGANFYGKQNNQWTEKRNGLIS